MTLTVSPFQTRVMSLPEELDVFLGGGRGGSKSFTLAVLALRHVEQYKERARILYVRQTYKGLADFELLTRDLFGLVYGTAARYNGAEHVWKFPNGAYLEMGQLESAGDYAKYQGRSFTLLLADEIGQYATPDLLDLLRSNLRGPKDVPVRVCFAGNPGGPGHHWVAKRFVFVAAPWRPFLEVNSKRQWVSCPSTFLDNPFIDQELYKAQLESSCPHDTELLRAWLEGDWAVARGAYFASVLDEARNAVDPWREIPVTYGQRWETYLAHDFGSSAPSVTYIVAVSPGATGPDDRFYPRGSLVLVDELATAQRDRPNVGLGWTVPILSEEIIGMCKRWGVEAEGVADDAVFAKGGHQAGSIADEFMRAGVRFYPALKGDRITGWNVMRRLLANAGKVDAPGLYVSRACAYFWETVPFLGRDMRRVEDVDSSQADHAADAVRYGCLRVGHNARLTRCVG